jgi:hypothetical protein
MAARSVDLTEIWDYELLHSLDFVLLVCVRSDGLVDGDSLVGSEAYKGCIQLVTPP